MSDPADSGLSTTQKISCKSHGWNKQGNSFKSLSKCFVCISGRRGLACRFSGCRSIVSKPAAATAPLVTFKYNAEADPQFRAVYNRGITLDIVKSKMAACAQKLLPVLLKEQQHTGQPNLIHRKREMDVRVTCDYCSAELFSASCLCSTCGRELCALCADSVHEPDSCASECTNHVLLPITYFQNDELDEVIKDMKFIMDSLPSEPRKSPDCGEYGARDLPKLDYDNLSVAEFLRYWSRSIPVVVTDVRIQGRWDPNYFIEHFGQQAVTLENGETGQTRKSTVADYFSTFGANNPRDGIWKLKDWPPQKALREAFPEIFACFNDCVPCSDIARFDGVWNMAAHFAINAIAPDLGPKMYNSQATVPDDQHQASTKLHMDMADAVNIMLWAGPLPDGKPGFAIWQIYPPEVSPILRKFLVEEGVFEGPGDPIHSQTINMTPTLLRRLWDRYRVRPYIYYQYPGEAVFIPAKSAHQVINIVDAIKIACDHVSIQHLDQIEQLVAEFREQRLASGHGEDVLQFYTMLWYAWLSLRQLREIVPAGELLGVVLDSSINEDISMAEPEGGLGSSNSSSNPVHGSSSAVSVDNRFEIVPVGESLDVALDPSIDEDISMAEPGGGLGSSSNPVHGSSSAVSVDNRFPAAHNQHNSTTAVTWRDRRRQRNKTNRRAKETGARPYNPGPEFRCPCCDRMLRRNGLIDHVLAAHSDSIVIDKDGISNLRKTGIIADSELLNALRSYSLP